MDNIRVIKDIQLLLKYHDMSICRDILLGIPCDELPNAYGIFGSRTSPVPCSGIIGEQLYLSSLFHEDTSQGLTYKRIGSCSSPASRFPVDEYLIATKDGHFLSKVFMDMYHPINSNKPIESFEIILPSDD